MAGEIAFALVGEADGVEAVGGVLVQPAAAVGGLQAGLGQEDPSAAVGRAGQQGKAQPASIEEAVPTFTPLT